MNEEPQTFVMETDIRDWDSLYAIEDWFTTINIPENAHVLIEVIVLEDEEDD